MKRTLISLSLCMAAVFSLGAMGSSVDGAALFKRCASCHGADGSKPPRVLKGQKPADILEKLKGYAAGTFGGQQKTVMQNMVKGLSPEDMQALVEYIGKL